jgi:2-isopropylmalate synthase
MVVDDIGKVHMQVEHTILFITVSSAKYRYRRRSVEAFIDAVNKFVE